MGRFLKFLKPAALPEMEVVSVSRSAKAPGVKVSKMLRHNDRHPCRPVPSQVFRAVPYCVLVIVLLRPLEGRSDDIALLIADDGHTMVWKRYHTALFAEFNTAPAMRKVGGYDHWEKPPWFVLDNDPGFQSLRAYTYRVADAGSIIRTGLVSVSGPKAYDSFIKDEVRRRKREFDIPTTVTPQGSRFKSVLQSPAWSGVDEDGDRYKSEFPDQHLAYKDGIFAMGDPGAKVFDFPFAHVKPLLRSAAGKSWYLSYQPGSVPPGVRGRFLAEVELNTGVNFQQYDNESTAAYALRRALGESYLTLFRSLLLDVDTATAWTKWPRGKNDPFTARLHFKIKPGSKLSRMTSALAARPREIPIPPGGSVSVATINANLTIPPAFRSIFQAAINNSALHQTPLGDALAGSIRQGNLLATLRINHDEQGRPVAFGAVRLQSEPASLRGLAELVHGEEESDKVTTSLQPSVFEQDFEAHQIVIGAEGKTLRFAAAPDKTSPPYDQSAQLFQRNRKANAPLVEIAVDLKPWLQQEGDSQCKQLLRGLETAYMRYGTWASEQNRRAAVKRKFGERVRMFPPRAPEYRNYESLVGRGNLDGDWTVKVSLRASAKSLIIDCRVGRDLHSYFVVRRCAAWPPPESR